MNYFESNFTIFLLSCLDYFLFLYSSLITSSPKITVLITFSSYIISRDKNVGQFSRVNRHRELNIPA